MDNLFREVPDRLPKELVSILLQDKHVRIERIVSTGHASSDLFWYDQEEHEWVILLRGSAKLRFEGAERPVLMNPGDHLHIHPHRKHQVEWTTPDEPTVWLAVFYKGKSLSELLPNSKDEPE